MGGGGQNTTEKNVDPWAGQQPYLADVFKNAQRLYNTGGPQYFPGSTVAAPSAATTQAQNLALTTAGGQQTGVANDAAQASNYLLTKAIDVNNNPALAGAITAAQRPVIQAFTDAGGPLAQTRADAVTAGQYGGNRQGIAEGIARGRLADTLGGISSTMANQAYESGLNAQKSALALAPTTQQTLLSPATTTSAVGQTQDAYQQALINEALQRWNYQQTLPWQNLQQYQNLIQGNYGMGGLTTSSGPQGNPLLGALGGAATGAGLYGALMASGAVNSWNPYGWAALAAGGLLGAMSS